MGESGPMVLRARTFWRTLRGLLAQTFHNSFTWQIAGSQAQKTLVCTCGCHYLSILKIHRRSVLFGTTSGGLTTRRHHMSEAVTHSCEREVLKNTNVRNCKQHDAPFS